MTARLPLRQAEAYLTTLSYCYLVDDTRSFVRLCFPLRRDVTL